MSDPDSRDLNDTWADVKNPNNPADLNDWADANNPNNPSYAGKN